LIQNKQICRSVIGTELEKTKMIIYVKRKPPAPETLFHHQRLCRHHRCCFRWGNRCRRVARQLLIVVRCHMRLSFICCIEFS